MTALFRVIATGILLVGLAGCSANHNSIFRLRTLSDASATIVTLDAKQRSILVANGLLIDGKPDPKGIRAFCAEPSPDVFSVIAQSLSAGGSFGKTADPTSIQAALNLAYGSAEQGSTIPRTQTINMLRELMYRTCERYLSGGYDATELSLQAIRDQRLMVSILAIEQLTGTVTPKPVVISAAGNGGAGVTGDAIVRLDDARKARDKAATDFASAQSAYDQANGTDKVCDAIKDKKDSELTDDQKAKVKPCNDLRIARDKALADQTRTVAAYQELSTLAQSGGVSVGTSVAANAPGGFDQATPPQSISSVAETVKDIVGLNFNDQTEIMMFCLRALREKPDDSKLNIREDQKQNLKSVCVNYLETGVQAAEARLRGQIAASNDLYNDATRAGFQAFWTSARQANLRLPAGLTQFVGWLRARLPSDEQGKADCFASAGDEATMMQCFGALTAREQNEAINH